MIFFLLIVLVAILIWIIKRQYSYWDRTNIPHLETSFPFGVIGPMVQKKRPFGLIVSDIYKQSTEKILGFHIMYKPYILVRDVQIARQILTSDFGTFHDRGLYVNEKRDPLGSHLLSLKGQQWRTLRMKLTPSFTSGKLKGMFGTIDDVGSNLVKYLNNQLSDKPEGKSFDIKEVMTTFAVDIIGSVIFGLDIDSFTNPNNEMRKMHTDIMNAEGIIENIMNASKFLCPPVTTFIKIMGFEERYLKNLLNIMKRTITFREENNITRKDVLQLLIQLRNTGKISEDDDKIWNVETAAENLKAMSIEMITANAFLFYIAGTETTSASAAFTIYELSMHPELLKRAQDEVLEVLGKHGLTPGGQFTYDSLQDMKFLELCLMESMRKYPGLPFLNRECNQDYHVPGTEYTIKKDTPVMISLFGLHRDPEYFPDPMRFNPERFLDETKDYDPIAYMPFGDGPRHCIAQRMGKLNSRLAVAKILANFDIETRPRKEVSFKFDTSPVLITEEMLKVHLSKKK